MQTAQQRTERAQRARVNGAKSRGPKTAAGLHRARTASIKTGLYTTSVSGICPESNEAFLPFHAKLLAYWQPQTSQAEILVNQLITVLWDTRLLQFGYNLYMSELADTLAATSPYADDPAKLIFEAQRLAVNTYCGTVARFQARLGACFRTRARIERQLHRFEKHPPTSAPSQKMLKINSQPYAALVQPDRVHSAGPEKSGSTSAPSQKILKPNGQPYAENVQNHAAPAANLQGDDAGTGLEKDHRTSAPSQKSLKTNAKPNTAVARPRHHHPARRE